MIKTPVTYIRWQRSARYKCTPYRAFRQAKNGKMEATAICGTMADWDTAERREGVPSLNITCKLCLRSLARLARYGEWD